MARRRPSEDSANMRLRQARTEQMLTEARVILPGAKPPRLSASDQALWLFEKLSVETRMIHGF